MFHSFGSAIFELLNRLLAALWADTEALADEDEKKSIYREVKGAERSGDA